MSSYAADQASGSARRLLRVGLVVGVVVHQAIVAAAPRDVPTYGARDRGPSVLLSNADGRSPYSGVVRYAGRAQCTAVFIMTVPTDEDPGDAPAYVLTNGHCPDFPGSNDVLVDQPSPAGRRVIFNYFADIPGAQVEVPVARVAYATMKGLDVAVLELAARYDDLVRRGFEPWPVTLTVPTRDEPVVVVGAPLQSGAAPAFLRLAACRLEARAPVVLEFIWHWFDYDRNQCADIQPGSSGSAVISRDTGRLLGLVSTTTISAVRYTECFLDHPCEPTPGDAASQMNTSYMTPLVRIDRCFDERGAFDVRRPTCPLDTGVQVRLTPAFLGAENPKRDAVASIGPPRQRWNVTVSGVFDHYRYKVVSAASGDCRDLRGYGMPRRVTQDPVIDDLLPLTEGHRFLCVVGGTETRWGATWQTVDHPTVVVIRIDTTPPKIPARVRIEESSDAWHVTFSALDPEISSHAFKFGRPGETRCDEPVGYRLALVPFLQLPKVNRPYLFCVIPYDSAGNAGALFETILP